ncbi:hypothetical protein EDC01DRAFT_646935 [Geopyxis carbonaria]|nr:hypothetical protein EDC01DRAFT_646935 [Geopyxis carbonaria]
MPHCRFLLLLLLLLKRMLISSPVSSPQHPSTPAAALLTHRTSAASTHVERSGNRGLAGGAQAQKPLQPQLPNKTAQAGRQPLRRVSRTSTWLGQETIGARGSGNWGPCSMYTRDLL